MTAGQPVPANGPGKTVEDGLSGCTPITHNGDPTEAPGSKLAQLQSLRAFGEWTS